MRIVDVLVWGTVAAAARLFGKAVANALGNMAATEAQARLDGVCFLLLRVARSRLPADLRVPLHDGEWVPELHHILAREEARPITRLVQGLAYSLSLLFHTRNVATEVSTSRSAPDATDKTHSRSDELSTVTLMYVAIAVLAVMVVIAIATNPLFLLLQLAAITVGLGEPRMMAKRRYATEIFERTRNITRDGEYETVIAQDCRRISSALRTALGWLVFRAH